MDAAPDSHGPIWQGATVLVVDNESIMRSLVRRTLEAEDFQVEEAIDSESAGAPVGESSGNSRWRHSLPIFYLGLTL